MSNIVIATLDENMVVISFMAFSNEAQLDRTMKECNKKGLKVRTMCEDEAKRHMKEGTPVK